MAGIKQRKDILQVNKVSKGSLEILNRVLISKCEISVKEKIVCWRVWADVSKTVRLYTSPRSQKNITFLEKLRMHFNLRYSTGKLPLARYYWHAVSFM